VLDPYLFLNSRLLFPIFYESPFFFLLLAKSSVLDFHNSAGGQAIKYFLFSWRYHHAFFKCSLLIKVVDHLALVTKLSIINHYLVDLIFNDGSLPSCEALVVAILLQSNQFFYVVNNYYLLHCLPNLRPCLFDNFKYYYF